MRQLFEAKAVEVTYLMVFCKISKYLVARGVHLLFILVIIPESKTGIKFSVKDRRISTAVTFLLSFLIIQALKFYRHITNSFPTLLPHTLLAGTSALFCCLLVDKAFILRSDYINKVNFVSSL